MGNAHRILNRLPRLAPALVAVALCALICPLAHIERSSQAAGPTPLREIRFAPDIPVNLGTATVQQFQIASDNLSGAVTLLPAFPGLPTDGSVSITGYHLRASGAQLLSFDSPVILPGSVIATSRDVVSFDGTNYAIFFSGAANGIPDGVNIDGVSMLSDADLLLSFDQTVALPGAAATTIYAQPADVV